MAATTIQTLATTTRPPRTKLVCFSFAAYAKNLIAHLKSLGIPILPGLNDDEFTYIESTYHFTFPPDLRSILREGLPVGPSFPNWRSSSQQQLQILLNLPVSSLLRNVSLNNFWSHSWGQKPQEKNHACSLVKQLLDKAPVLVPIYRNCYIPSTPNVAGNPVFYVDTEEVKILSFDLAGFFKEEEFLQAGVFNFTPLVRKSLINIDTPVWAAKEARRIEFWTEVAERGKKLVARCDTRGWWNGSGSEKGILGLNCCLEQVFWRLRDGGWKEDEVREMMMMNGRDDGKKEKSGVQVVGNHRESLLWQMRVLSLVLLRAGWSREDVVYSLDLQDHDQTDGGDYSIEGNSPCVEVQHPSRCSKQKDDHHKGSSLKQLMGMTTNLIL